MFGRSAWSVIGMTMTLIGISHASAAPIALATNGPERIREFASEALAATDATDAVAIIPDAGTPTPRSGFAVAGFATDGFATDSATTAPMYARDITPATVPMLMADHDVDPTIAGHQTNPQATLQSTARRIETGGQIVPEPSTMALLMLGMGLGYAAHQRRRRQETS